MRNLPMLLMIALLAAPVAAAQEKNTPSEDPARPDDAAWVDDCPPDMMCAAGAGEPHQYGEDGCIECSGPSDGEAVPGQAIGPEDCIDCMQPPRDDVGTCMDGEQENETCRDDVQYLGGEPTRGPSDGSCEYCRGDDGEAVPISAPADNSGGEVGVTSDAKENAVPAAGFGIALAAIALGAVLVIRKL